MKHYAPNRCLYIKVAKLRTGVGSAEMSHLQNCSLKIYLKRALGGGGGGRVGGGGGEGQDGCERRIKVFVKIKKIYFFFEGGGVGSGWGGRVRGVRVYVNREVKFLRKLKKKKLWGGGGIQVGGGGGGVRVVVNEELKFL